MATHGFIPVPIPAAPRGALAGRRVAFTGRLASMPQSDVFARVRRAGGHPVASLSGNTDLLVVGVAAWPLQPDGRVNRNLARAVARLDQPGFSVVDEAAFLGLLGERPAPPRFHTPETARRILGVDDATLALFRSPDLLRRTPDGLCDARDVAALRMLADLHARGVRESALGDSLATLERVLPVLRGEIERLRNLLRSAQPLLARLGEPLIAPDGQMLLGFAPAADERPVLLAFRPAERTAADWLDRGLELEEDERHDEAVDAYRRAFALDPRQSEALFNLGNVLRATGRDDAAIEMYRLAAALDPAAAHAWYNIADVLESQGRADEALQCLRAALAIAPAYADAHYNAARLLELAGHRDDAAAHWSSYLTLDTTSAWADTARRHLAAREVERRIAVRLAPPPARDGGATRPRS